MRILNENKNPVNIWRNKILHPLKQPKKGKAFHKLEYSVGLTMDKEVRDDDTKDSTLSALISMHYLRPIFSSSSFESSINIYPDFKDFSGNLKADGRFSLSTPLTKVSSLKLSLHEKYQAKVLPGIKELDTIITTSISYKF